ncbi:unnamed protein product [Sphagnum balticum]
MALRGISAELLMETAGLEALRIIKTQLRTLSPIAVLSGPGNNGADGLVVARHLLSCGFNPQVFFIGDSKKVSPLFTLQRQRLEAMGGKIGKLADLSHLKEFNTFVDALFGIGLERPLEGEFLDVVSFLNSSKKRIVSLDIPSGLNATSGRVMNVAVKASLTLTFGLAKPGLLSSEGSECCGKVKVLSLGIPQDIIDTFAKSHFLVTRSWVRPLIPTRKNTSNKFTYGRLYILAGRPGTWGAAALSAKGAYRIGAGYVTLVVQDKKTAKAYLGHHLGPEVLTTSIDDESIFKKASAVVVGPGAGESEDLKGFIRRLRKENLRHVVLDADALTALSQMRDFEPLPSWILTPHTGELSRLLNISSKEIEAARFESVLKAVQKFKCGVLLKGFHSQFCDSEGRIGIINSGNAALAKAGTGDVLSGFIGGLMSQSLLPSDATMVGAYLHGFIADKWIEGGQNIKSFVASDLITHISSALTQVERG